MQGGPGGGDGPITCPGAGAGPGAGPGAGAQLAAGRRGPAGAGRGAPPPPGAARPGPEHSSHPGHRRHCSGRGRAGAGERPARGSPGCQKGWGVLGALVGMGVPGIPEGLRVLGVSVGIGVPGVSEGLEDPSRSGGPNRDGCPQGPRRAGGILARLGGPSRAGASQKSGGPGAQQCWRAPHGRGFWEPWGGPRGPGRAGGAQQDWGSPPGLSYAPVFSPALFPVFPWMGQSPRGTEAPERVGTPGLSRSRRRAALHHFQLGALPLAQRPPQCCHHHHRPPWSCHHHCCLPWSCHCHRHPPWSCHHHMPWCRQCHGCQQNPAAPATGPTGLGPLGHPLLRVLSRLGGTHTGDTPSHISPQIPTIPIAPTPESPNKAALSLLSWVSVPRLSCAVGAAPADNTPSVRDLISAEELFFFILLCCQRTLSPLEPPPAMCLLGLGSPPETAGSKAAVAKRFQSLRHRGTPHRRVTHLTPWGLAPGPFSGRDIAGLGCHV